MVGHALSLLILSEDGSLHAHHTLSALASQMLKLAEPSVQTHRVHFQPAEGATRFGVRANLWKSWRSPSPRDQRAIKNLRRTLATKILEEGTPGYVLFHFDGDCQWSARTHSENAAKFAAFIQGLRLDVAANLERRGLPCETQDVQARLRRICPITPYYSIEAWLYQNTALARSLCERSCGKHTGVIERWKRDRTLLDELLKPKDYLCLGSRHNRELAETFSSAIADATYEVGKSFHETVERLQACPGISDALRNTWAPPLSPP